MALDCVGDVVIEDGQIGQDYEEELRRIADNQEV